MRRFVFFTGALGCALLFLLAGAGEARAVRGAGNYPKLACWVCGSTSAARLDTLARYDMLVWRERPWSCQEVRRRNPEVQLFFNWMPQNIVSWGEGETTWYPDTTWSIIRLAEFYAQKNDWFLRDIHGQRMPEWGGWVANWTRYCPRGTYGTARGLTYVEWLVQVAIPQIMENGGAWNPWGPGSGGYDGLDLEVLVDCPGSFGYEIYEYADPDQDGQAEGVHAGCSMGGDADSLSILYREMNEIFHPKIAQLQDDGLLVLLNCGNVYMGPAWRTDVTGIKLEGWQSFYNIRPWLTWWDTFYGVRGESDTVWGTGYKWAESFVGHGRDPSIEGWEHTVIEVMPAPGYNEEFCQRTKRWGFGTALLGDGYFAYTKDECLPWWQPEYDWDFGTPLGGFFRETLSGATLSDTLYVRLFSRGFAEVNPNAFDLGGIPAKDSRFGFWQTISDLRAARGEAGEIKVAFTAAPCNPSPVDGYELRYATGPVTPDNWDQATPYAGNPIGAGAGAPVEVTVGGLGSSTTFHFLLRNRVYGRLEPAGSNAASATTAITDTLPPDRITDAAADSAGESWIQLAWTAPADSGSADPASRYLLAFRAGAPIETEEDWNASTLVESGLPVPSPAGTRESYRLDALSPETGYGIAVRAADASGLLSRISNALAAQTLPLFEPPPDPPDSSGTPPDSTGTPPDSTVAPPDSSGNPPPPPRDLPPAPIWDFSTVARGTTWVDLAWTATGEDSLEGRAASYVLRFRPGSAIASEEDWAVAESVTVRLPLPAYSGVPETFRWNGIAPTTSGGIALRARDAAGQLSTFVPGLILDAAAEPAQPDPPPPDAFAVAGAGARAATLSWRHPAVPPGGDPLSLYLIGIAPVPITETNWPVIGKFTNAPPPGPAGEEASCVIGPLLPEQDYFVAMRTRDSAGRWSALSTVVPFATGAEDLAPPAPPETPNVSWDQDRSGVTITCAASADPRVTGYYLYREGAQPGWVRVASPEGALPTPEPRWDISAPDPNLFHRVAVTAVVFGGAESMLSGSTTVWEGSAGSEWRVEGPYPQPVGESCRIRVQVPPAFDAAAPLTVEIRGLTGARIATLRNGPCVPGSMVECVWDRRSREGERAAPGFYYLLVTGDGRRDLRTIYVGP